MDTFHIEAVRPGREDTGLPGAADPSGRPRCAAIIAESPAGRSTGLEAALAAVAEGGAVSVRVGNLLSSPLTLHRILFQLNLDEEGEDGADMDDEARLAGLLEERRGAHDRIVLVVERAETLDTDALLSLQRLAGAPGAVQVLFVGAPAFWALLDDAALVPFRQALSRQGTEPEAVAPAATVVHPMAAAVRPSVGDIPDRPAGPMAEPQSAVPARSGRRWWIAGAVGLAVTSALGAAALLAPAGLFHYAAPPRDMPTPAETAAGPGQPPAAPPPASPMSPVASAPPAPAPPEVAAPGRPMVVEAGPSAPGAPATPSLPARAGTPQNRTRSEPVHPPDVPSRGADTLTDARRDLRSGQPRQPEQSVSGPPRVEASTVSPSPSEGRVVIHYRNGSGAGAAEADRLAAAVAPLAARVQTRVVADTPSAPVVRFFHPADGARAHQLAGALSRSGSRWDVRDFGSFRPRPSPGTIEVWTPIR